MSNDFKKDADVVWPIPGEALAHGQHLSAGDQPSTEPLPESRMSHSMFNHRDFPQSSHASTNLRDQLRHCFRQATMAGRFSEEYCIDRIMELFAQPSNELLDLFEMFVLAKESVCCDPLNPVSEEYKNRWLPKTQRAHELIAAHRQPSQDSGEPGQDAEVLQRRIRSLEGNLKDLNLLYIQALSKEPGERISISKEHFNKLCQISAAAKYSLDEAFQRGQQAMAEKAAQLVRNYCCGCCCPNSHLPKSATGEEPCAGYIPDLPAAIRSIGGAELGQEVSGDLRSLGGNLRDTDSHKRRT